MPCPLSDRRRLLSLVAVHAHRVHVRLAHVLRRMHHLPPRDRGHPPRGTPSVCVCVAVGLQCCMLRAAVTTGSTAAMAAAAAADDDDDDDDDAVRGRLQSLETRSTVATGATTTTTTTTQQQQ
jgi:hypothetical protein